MTDEADMMNVTPGKSAIICYTLNGFDLKPLVKWTFIPEYPTSVGQDSNEAYLNSTTDAYNDSREVSLLISYVLYKHAGQYLVTITNPRTGEEIIKSCKHVSTDN